MYALFRLIMKNILICYPKCSTCQKAKKWLIDNCIPFVERHIVQNAPSAQELEKWIQLSDQDIKKFFNTSGLKYKELGLKDKLNHLNFEEKIELLSNNGMLIKRPLLVAQDNKILIGFKKQEWEEYFHINCKE